MEGLSAHLVFVCYTLCLWRKIQKTVFSILGRSHFVMFHSHAYRSSCLFCEVQKFAFFTNGPSFVKFSSGLHNKTSNSYQKNCFVQSHMLAFHQYYSPRLLYIVITSNHRFHTEIVLHFCLLVPISTWYVGVAC